MNLRIAQQQIHRLPEDRPYRSHGLPHERRCYADCVVLIIGLDDRNHRPGIDQDHDALRSSLPLPSLLLRFPIPSLKILRILPSDIFGGVRISAVHCANEILDLLIDRHRAFFSLHPRCHRLPKDFGRSRLPAARYIDHAPLHLSIQAQSYERRRHVFIVLRVRIYMITEQRSEPAPPSTLQCRSQPRPSRQ